MRYAIVAVVASSITIFALQNHAPVSVRFLVWSLDATSLAAVILVSTAAGILLVGLPLWLDRWRLRSHARALESQLASAQARAAEAARQPPRSGSPAP